jgi:hypothetical protein
MFIDNESFDNPSKPENIPPSHPLAMTKKTSYSLVNSTFFEQENTLKKKDKITVCSNTTIRDCSQIKHLNDTFRKEVGPEFGFDLA